MKKLIIALYLTNMIIAPAQHHQVVENIVHSFIQECKDRKISIPKYNSLTIEISDNLYGRYGLSKRNNTGDVIIVIDKRFMKYRSSQLLTLLVYHELVHGLFLQWNHTDKYHIMNPGLFNRQYLSIDSHTLINNLFDELICQQ